MKKDLITCLKTAIITVIGLIFYDYAYSTGGEKLIAAIIAIALMLSFLYIIFITTYVRNKEKPITNNR